jgi:hypothetical protein
MGVVLEGSIVESMMLEWGQAFESKGRIVSLSGVQSLAILDT